MAGIAFILAQLALPDAAAPSPEIGPLPDIEIRARVEVRRVEVEQEGEATIELQAEPEEARFVRVERSAPPGRNSYSNLTINLNAVARIVDPATAAGQPTSAVNKPTGEPE